MQAICWSYQPPPTLEWLPGNHTCLSFVVVFPSRRSHRAGRNEALGSSSARAWKAFSTLVEICVLVNFHVEGEKSQHFCDDVMMGER